MSPKKASKRTPRTVKREIEGLDQSILEAIEKRANLVGELANLAPDEETSPRVPAKNPKTAGNPATLQLLRQIDGYCQSQVTPRRICYLGPIFSYSYLAATQHFGAHHDLVPVTSIAAVFSQVAQGESQYGVVPIENSTDGRIADTLTMFSKHPVSICNEIHVPIHHCLIGTGKLADVREIRSKAQALSQCRHWLDKSFSSKVQRVATASSSDAAQDAKQSGKKVAAIASREAAVGLGLKVLAANIEDQKGNLTRFAVIFSPHHEGVQAPRKTGKDKSSIMFAIPHRPGSLADVINVFKRSKLNLTWIESFPKPGAFSEYTFFAEFQGHRDEVKVRNAMNSLTKKTEELTFLGSYPEFCA